MAPRSDVSGVLAAIDNALGDGLSSPDAMRWAPPRSAVTFTWDTTAENGSAMFSSVDTLAIESLLPGHFVHIDGRRYQITSKVETAERGFEIELERA